MVPRRLLLLLALPAALALGACGGGNDSSDEPVAAPELTVPGDNSAPAPRAAQPDADAQIDTTPDTSTAPATAPPSGGTPAPTATTPAPAPTPDQSGGQP